MRTRYGIVNFYTCHPLLFRIILYGIHEKRPPPLSCIGTPFGVCADEFHLNNILPVCDGRKPPKMFFVVENYIISICISQELIKMIIIVKYRRNKPIGFVPVLCAKTRVGTPLNYCHLKNLQYY